MEKHSTKKREKKLTLSRETLRRIQDTELSQVDGAQGPPTGDCGSAKTFCATCTCPPKA